MEMTQFLQQNVLYIVSSFLLLLMFKTTILAKVYRLESVSANEAFQLFQKKSSQTVFLDVRTPWELEREPKIKKSVLIPLSELSKRADEIKQMGDDKKIIIVCRSGSRAKSAGVKLKRAGISDVHVLSGGMNSWRNADYPVTKVKFKASPRPT